LVAVAVAEKAYPAYPAPSYKAATYETYVRFSYYIFNFEILIKIVFLNQQPASPYTYSYDVKDDYSYVNMGHQESNDGKVVSGSYRVALPDGRIQTVTYKDDGYGLVADVKYEGYAKYPEYNKPAAYPTKAYPAKAAYPAPAEY